MLKGEFSQGKALRTPGPNPQVGFTVGGLKCYLLRFVDPREAKRVDLLLGY